MPARNDALTTTQRLPSFSERAATAARSILAALEGNQSWPEVESRLAAALAVARGRQPGGGVGDGPQTLDLDVQFGQRGTMWSRLDKTSLQDLCDSVELLDRLHRADAGLHDAVAFNPSVLHLAQRLGRRLDLTSGALAQVADAFKGRRSRTVAWTGPGDAGRVQEALRCLEPWVLRKAPRVVRDDGREGVRLELERDPQASAFVRGHWLTALASSVVREHAAATSTPVERLAMLRLELPGRGRRRLELEYDLVVHLPSRNRILAFECKTGALSRINVPKQARGDIALRRCLRAAAPKLDVQSFCLLPGRRRKRGSEYTDLAWQLEVEGISLITAAELDETLQVAMAA